MNPRSVYNKIDEFHTFVEQESLDLLCMSESFEREELKLNQILKLEDQIVISSVNQRSGKGEIPALIVNAEKYHVKDLTNTLIQIP